MIKMSYRSESISPTAETRARESMGK